MAITFSIIGGADAAKFSLGAASGALAFLVAPNFEIPTDADGNNVYQVIVRATDSGGAFSNQTINVTVTDVADTGTLPALSPSGTINVSANNTLIENKEITGMIQNVGFSNLTVRNCIIRHNLQNGLNVYDASGLTVEDCSFFYTPNPG